MLVDERMRNLAKLLDVSALRARVHAENLAHQNTPGYRAKAVAFEESFRTALERGDGASARQVEAVVYEPRSTALDNDGNDVSADAEISAQAQNQLLYQAYIAMLRGKHQIYNSAIRGDGGGGG